MERRLLTTGEAARYCGVNFRTVIRWIERKQLKAYKLPGRGDNRIEVSELIRFLNSYDMPIPEDLQPLSNRILVVEDDPAMANTIRRILKLHGVEVMIALDGFQAGAMLSANIPALMTLDLNIPGLDGLEVLKFVRSSERLKYVKILVISAMGEDKLQEALDAGADDLLAKPFTAKELIEKVRELTQFQIDFRLVGAAPCGRPCHPEDGQAQGPASTK